MNLEGMRRQLPGGDGLPVTLCHHGEALLPRLARTAALATGWRACTVALSAVSKTPNRLGMPRAAIVGVGLPKCAGGDKLS
jgi:hypothetical protein